MNIQKLLTSSLIAALVFFLLGWLLYGHLLMSFFHHNPGRKGHLERPDMIFYLIILANLLQGFLLAFIFSKCTIQSVAEGFFTAAIIGFLITASMGLLTLGSTYITSKKAVAADIACATIIWGIAGALVGMVVQKMDKQS
jgi:hypothetical protein